MPDHLHHVALSFAGQQRQYVRQVAKRLQDWGVRFFFDEGFVIEMWGQDLNEYLLDMYGHQARAVVMFVSRDYEAKVFPTVERRAAFAAAMHRGVEVWPVKFDDTELPGLNENIAYLRAEDYAPDALADVIASKLALAGIPLARPISSSVIAMPRSASTALLSVVVQDSNGQHVAGASVSVVSANGTIVTANEQEGGQYSCAAPSDRLVRIWVAHPDHPSLIERDVVADDDLRVTLGAAAGAGSVTMGSTGYVPSVKGRFSPILDSNDRTYVYIENAAVDGRAASPASFSVAIPFEVEDADGSVTVVTIVDISGHGALVEYRSPS